METKRCPRCGEQTLAGLSNAGRAAALDVALDLLELDAAGELDAVRGGRRTWTLHHVGDVFARGPRQIIQWPAGQAPRRTVHADHVCGQEEGA
jgi:hypothetical protein